MCKYCDDHTHSHEHHDHPQIVQIMPAQKELYAVYHSEKPIDCAVKTGKNGLSLVPVLFMGLIKHGEKTMVEGFFASSSINSCEDIKGFKGYAASIDDAEKLYVNN
ncbi:MAG: hypothetical protein KAI40_08505 [Desulfobacterales bacterium]|nr:hypothetical protein [Desulfobacterales bacterium]